MTWTNTRHSDWLQEMSYPYPYGYPYPHQQPYAAAWPSPWGAPTPPPPGWPYPSPGLAPPAGWQTPTPGVMPPPGWPAPTPGLAPPGWPAMPAAPSAPMWPPQTAAWPQMPMQQMPMQPSLPPWHSSVVGQPAAVRMPAPIPWPGVALVTPQLPYPDQTVTGLVSGDVVARPVQASTPVAGRQPPAPELTPDYHNMGEPFQVPHTGQVQATVTHHDVFAEPQSPREPSETSTLEPAASRKKRRRAKKVPRESPAVETEFQVTIPVTQAAALDISSEPSEAASLVVKRNRSGPPQPEQEPDGKPCPVFGCTATVVPVLRRHVITQHLPWYAQPHTACWCCQKQFFRPALLQRHLQSEHPGVRSEANWGPTVYAHYYERMRFLIVYMASLRSFQSIKETYRYVRCTGVFSDGNDQQQPEINKELWDGFSYDLGLEPNQEEHDIYKFNSPGCLLHWRALLALMVPIHNVAALNKIQIMGLDGEIPVGLRVEATEALLRAPAVAATTQGSTRAAVSTDNRSQTATTSSGVTAEQSAVATRMEQPMDHGAMAQACFPDSVADTGGKPHVWTKRSLEGRAPPPVALRQWNAPDMVGIVPRAFNTTQVVVTNGAYLTDAHCHLYLLSRENKQPYKLSELRCGNKKTVVPGYQTPPSATPRVRLGYAIECFMLNSKQTSCPNFQALMSDHPAARLTISIHPNEVAQSSQGQLRTLVDRLFAHLSEPGVVGLGEIGLDYCKTKSEAGRKQQQETLIKILRHARADRHLKKLPIVLHVRDETPYQLQASEDCIRALQTAEIPRDHPVYRHCFVGGQQEATWWLRAFPHTFFGLNPLVVAQSAHSECPKVFYNLDLARIVLETDSPKLKLKSSDTVLLTPWSTWYLGRWLAALKGLSLGETLAKVCENVCELYKLAPPHHSKL